VPFAGRCAGIRGATADEAAAGGLIRHPYAPPIEVLEARLYRAQLKARMGADAPASPATARARHAEHWFGNKAERALTLTHEARLRTAAPAQPLETGERAGVVLHQPELIGHFTTRFSGTSWTPLRLADHGEELGRS
jgi:hypothetical protein